MDFAAWKPRYEAILKEFDFSRRDDETTARRLGELLQGRSYRPAAVWMSLGERFRGQSVAVVGAGDEGPRQLRAQPPPGPMVAADGATSAALEAGWLPDLIVSDLDGNVKDELEAVRRGSRIAIHAHGDNRAALERWVREFTADHVVGTCQCEPRLPLRNYGGFTDGDRACFIAHGLGATRLTLYGFDFSGKIGRYTGTFDPKTKPQKLAWARRLIDELSRDGIPIDYA